MERLNKQPRRQRVRGAAVALGLGFGIVGAAAYAAPDITVRYFPIENFVSPLSVSLSEDGRYAAYRQSSGSGNDVFVWDLIDNTRTQANLMVGGGAPTGAQCDTPAMSADARYVVFGCASATMGSGTVNGGQAYYVYDRINNKTEIIPLTTADRVSRTYAPAISADGHYIAYRTYDAASPANYSLFVRNMFNKTTHGTTAKSVFVAGVPSPMSISDDGRYVAYSGRIVPSNSIPDVSVYDSATSSTEVINVSTAGVRGTRGANYPSMSADGNIVAFLSADFALTSPAAPANGGVFIRDRRAGTTEFISSVGAGASTNYPTLSANGRYVAFVGRSAQGILNLYVYDRSTKISRVIPTAIEGTRSAIWPTFSANGRYLAFESVQGGTRAIGIADLGTAAGLELSSSTLSLTEGGAAGTYSIALAQVPNADVTVAIKPDKQLSVARTQLTFTPDNWKVSQIVSVQAIQDGVKEGEHSGVLTHTVASSDVDYTVIQPSNVTASITDAVTPTIAVPGTTWNQSNMPLTGTAAPGATVMLTAVNRDTSWMSSVSTVANAQGQWSYTMTGFTDGVVDLDAQAEGIRSAVQTITVKLAVIPPQPTYIDVTGYIRTTAYGLILNRATGKYAGNFVLTNSGSILLKGPLHLRLDNLTAGVTLFNATGSHEGAPYITVPGGLAPDESVTIPLLVTNPAKVTVSYDAKIFSGTF